MRYHSIWKKKTNNPIPSKVNNISSYNLLNEDNYIIPKCRHEIYKRSFVPDSISKWNSLGIESRQATAIRRFHKNVSSNSINNPKPPTYFSYGPLLLNIIHIKHRHTCILNYDLYRCNIVNSPLCSRGMREDTYHFFFTCNIRIPDGCNRSAEDAYSSAAPDPTFAFFGGLCCPTLDFVIAFWIMIAFYTLLTSLFCI
jgi:hypothetical protein